MGKPSLTDKAGRQARITHPPTRKQFGKLRTDHARTLPSPQAAILTPVVSIRTPNPDNRAGLPPPPASQPASQQDGPKQVGQGHCRRRPLTGASASPMAPRRGAGQRRGWRGRLLPSPIRSRLRGPGPIPPTRLTAATRRAVVLLSRGTRRPFEGKFAPIVFLTSRFLLEHELAVFLSSSACCSRLRGARNAGNCARCVAPLALTRRRSVVDVT